MAADEPASPDIAAEPSEPVSPLESPEPNTNGDDAAQKSPLVDVYTAKEPTSSAQTPVSKAGPTRLAQASTSKGVSQNDPDDAKESVWIKLLASAAPDTNTLLQKHVLVLGGTPATQLEFLDTVSRDFRRKGRERGPVTNEFALTYTYYDVKANSSTNDPAARVSAYLLSAPSPAFHTLVRPLFTVARISNMAVVILLDWSNPYTWLRQLCDWVSFLHLVTKHLDSEVKGAMDRVMAQWKVRGKARYPEHLEQLWNTGNLDGAIGGTTLAADGSEGSHRPGEWENPVGLPLVVVCQNTQVIPALKKEYPWKDEYTDTVQMFLRSVLIRHGAGLVYTTNIGRQDNLYRMVHLCLGLCSDIMTNAPDPSTKSSGRADDSKTGKLKIEEGLKPKTAPTENDATVFIPVGWDSFSRLREFTTRYGCEKLSDLWANDLQEALSRFGVISRPPSEAGDADTHDKSDASAGAVQVYNPDVGDGQVSAGQGRSSDVAAENTTVAPEKNKAEPPAEPLVEPKSAIQFYEQELKSPDFGGRQREQEERCRSLDEEAIDYQAFLKEQHEELKKVAAASRTDQPKTARRDFDSSGRDSPVAYAELGDPLIVEVGGKRYEAQSAVENIVGHTNETPEPTSPDAEGSASPTKTDSAALDTRNMNTEQLQSFFTNLLTKKSG